MICNTVGQSVAGAWVARVQANGGAAPSAGTVSAAGAFYDALLAASLTSKMISVNIVAPDNLVAATTPLIVGPGNDPWTNTSFIAGDLTVNGLDGDGATKYLNTGVVPNTAFASDTSGGLTCYQMGPAVSAVATEVVMGCQNTINTTYCRLAASVGANLTLFETWDNNPAQGRVAIASIAQAGFLSGSRTSAAASALYYATSVIPISAIGSIITAGGSRPNQTIYAYAQKANTGVASNFSNQRISFFAIHEGLTSGESSSFFTAVQALRTALGGGYV